MAGYWVQPDFGLIRIWTDFGCSQISAGSVMQGRGRVSAGFQISAPRMPENRMPSPRMQRTDNRQTVRDQYAINEQSHIMNIMYLFKSERVLPCQTPRAG